MAKKQKYMYANRSRLDSQWLGSLGVNNDNRKYPNTVWWPLMWKDVKYCTWTANLDGKPKSCSWRQDPVNTARALHPTNAKDCPTL